MVVIHVVNGLSVPLKLFAFPSLENREGRFEFHFSAFFVADHLKAAELQKRICIRVQRGIAPGVVQRDKCAAVFNILSKSNNHVRFHKLAACVDQNGIAVHQAGFNFPFADINVLVVSRLQISSPDIPRIGFLRLEPLAFHRTEERDFRLLAKIFPKKLDLTLMPGHPAFHLFSHLKVLDIMVERMVGIRIKHNPAKPAIEKVANPKVFLRSCTPFAGAVKPVDKPKRSPPRCVVGFPAGILAPDAVIDGQLASIV